jgi:hypothetical protein
MELTAVSLARSVLQSVVSSARSAVADEVALLLGVPREVEFIRNELDMMQSFLRVASARPDAVARKETVRTWVNQVRDLANDVEDCLFEFASYSATAPAWSSWLPDSLTARHRLAERIRDLKASVEELNQRNLRYHLIVDPPSSAAEVDEEEQQLLPYHDSDGPSDADHAFPEWDIIGRDKDKEELIKHLISGGDGRDLAVVLVWGMGGMGKSSLVSMVRNDPKLLDAYDCGAWVTMRHPLDTTDFMRRLGKEPGLRPAAAHDDPGGLREHLKDKRYMIVVDDLQTKKEWDQVWPKLSNLKNTKGSHIIVTTRLEDVARHCAGSVREGHSHVHELKPLEKEESMNLLLKKVSTSLPRKSVIQILSLY